MIFLQWAKLCLLCIFYKNKAFVRLNFDFNFHWFIVETSVHQEKFDWAKSKNVYIS